MLKEYQRKGVSFMWDRLGRGAGGILCDDMGLGKTVQVIALLSAVYRKCGEREDKERIRALKRDERSTEPTLIICPGSVLSNWEEELERWGHFHHLKYHGKDRAETFAQVRRGRVEVVLTTFETAREHYQELDLVLWQMVVVDECHKIKEKNSGTTRALKSLSCLKRIGLTGTALQNKYEELWCLLDWANPGCLGSLEHFKAEFSLPMIRGFRQDASSDELSEAQIKQEEFNAQKQHWMIRRTKAEYGDKLPAKSDQVIFCGLSSFQREVFKFLLAMPEVKAVFSSLEECPCGKKRPRHKCCQRPEETSTSSSPQILLQLIHVFLKAANHAALLLPQNTSSAAQAELSEEICQGCVSKFPELRDSNFLNLSNPRYSGKMEVLASLLTVLESERAKVLLFSYSTTLLTILETYIESKGYSYCRLDGSTKVGARQEMVNQFNRDQGTFIFLLSTKAGGLGLNITGANTVIIFDPNWNPSHDMQAQDRAYRLGQTRDVTVFRLISAGCIEEIVYLRQLYKQQLAANSIDGCSAKRLFKAVQGDKKRKGELFGIRNLFRVTSSPRSCLTQDIERRHSDIENKILKKSRVTLTVQNFELTDSVLKEGNVASDPFQIGLDEDLDEDFCEEGGESPERNLTAEERREKYLEKVGRLLGLETKRTEERILAMSCEEKAQMYKDLYKSDREKQSVESRGGGKIVYSHSNDKLVGGSEAEDIIRGAMRLAERREGSNLVNEINFDGVNPEEECRKLIQTDKYNPGETADLSRTVETQDTTYVYGRTPADQRRRCLTQIAHQMGLGQVEVASKVLEMSWLEKLDMIKQFHSTDDEAVKILEECSIEFINQWRVRKLRDISYNKVGAIQTASDKTKLVSKGVNPGVSPALIKEVSSEHEDVYEDKTVDNSKDLCHIKIVTSEDDDADRPQKQFDCTRSSSSIDLTHRPLKPAPEGVYFKKRRIENEKQSDEIGNKSMRYKSSELEIDDLFPSPKLKILNFDDHKKDVKGKKYEIIEESIDDIFG